MANVNVDDINSKSGMRKYFEEFANNSTIHGFNHLAARHRHPLERFLAGMFILGGFACFIYVSIVSWYQYQYDGFFTMLDQQQELIRLVKPSVIICPTDLIDESKFPATLKRYDIEDTPKNREFFHFLSNYSLQNVITFENAMYIPDYQAAPPELWLRILYDLKKDFYYETSLPGEGTWFVVEDGICFSIGNHISPYANIAYISAKNSTVGVLPMYPPDVSDYQVENREIDDPNYVPSYVYYQNENITEFLRLDIDAWVEIIDPMEIYKIQGPRHLTRTFEQLFSTVEVQLLANIKRRDNLLNNKNRRKCRIPLDKGLEMWPIYTYLSCVAEHRAKLLKNKCGCYPHFFPRISGVPVCNITQLRCIVRYYIVLMRSNTVQTSFSVCFFNCNFVYFSERIVKLENAVPRNYTNIEINIIFPQYKYSMKERFSFIDLMIAVGSAAGLFLGCSVLSGVEIFYYATLHFYISKRKYKGN